MRGEGAMIKKIYLPIDRGTFYLCLHCLIQRMERAKYDVVPVETDRKGDAEDNIKMLCGHLGEYFLDLVFVNQLYLYTNKEEKNPFRSES